MLSLLRSFGVFYLGGMTTQIEMWSHLVNWKVILTLEMGGLVLETFGSKAFILLNGWGGFLEKGMRGCFIS